MSNEVKVIILMVFALAILITPLALSVKVRDLPERLDKPWSKPAKVVLGLAIFWALFGGVFAYFWLT